MANHTHIDVEIAYFRNNYTLHNHLNNVPHAHLLHEEELEAIKENAQESEVFNKSHGEGDSVLDVIDAAIAAVKKGYLVYYTASL